MAKLFEELRERLLLAGVAPRHVRRYLSELADHLDDLREDQERSGSSRAKAEASAFARLGREDHLAQAMIEQRHFRSWTARAPWAAFGLGPLLALAGAYLLSVLILWSGWRMFLPGVDTPFGGHHPHGFENLYFQTGKALYFGAPVLVGWGFGLLAARQRSRWGWPAAGLVLTALVGVLARVQAGRTAVPDLAIHIRMDLGLWTSLQGALDALVHASVIFLATALPYVVWRLRRPRLLSA